MRVFSLLLSLLLVLAIGGGVYVLLRPQPAPSQARLTELVAANAKLEQEKTKLQQFITSPVCTQ